MADIELVVKIPKELYEAYKGRPPMLGDAGIDMIAQAIANGIPLDEIREEIRDIRYSGGLPTAEICGYIKCLKIIDRYIEGEQK